ncbi:hypothetical protein ACF1G0_09980 [Streptomyces sp. NPDC013953]|uniref:hypothetical protein n=1 Tax=Streptomyces sp. NPDC013953 TaxID=3364868 RepID=UPI0036F9E690
MVRDARRISDADGLTVPYLDHREERTQHAEHFGRRTDEECVAYCEKKDHVGVSLDGLPALPLPLPRRTDTVRGCRGHPPVRTRRTGGARYRGVASGACASLSCSRPSCWY